MTNIIIDPAKLKQILYNYISNALKFTKEGGTVNIRILPEGPEFFKLEVEDNGIGIRAEDIHKLFSEFQQLDASLDKKYQGTGLGLALIKRIAEALGGKVGVNSIVNQGSTFFVTLPRVPLILNQQASAAAEQIALPDTTIVNATDIVDKGIGIPKKKYI